MLEVNQLHYTPGSRFQLTVPRWRLEPGHFHALVGRNGAGKSSLLKC